MSRFSVLSVISTLAAVLVATSPTFAIDSVTKKSDGKKITGSISGMSKTEISLKRSQGEETIPANDIALIEWDGGGANLKLAYTEENVNQLDSALQDFVKAKTDAKSPSTYLQGEIDYAIARVTGKQSLTDPDKRTSAIQKLTAVLKAHPEHVRYFDAAMLLAQVQLAAKEFEGARASLEMLKKSPWNETKLAVLLFDARILMDEGKLDEANAAFESAANAVGDAPNGQARKSEAILGQARVLVMQSKFEQAVKVLSGVIDGVSQEDEKAVQAEAHVLRGQALQGLGRNKEATLDYLYVDVICPKEARFHAEALYQLSILWKLIQHPDRSAEAAGKLVQNYPNSEWRKKLSGNE